MLDVQTALVRAQQEMRKTERDATDLVKDEESLVQLREAKASIEQLINRMNTSETLVAERERRRRGRLKVRAGESRFPTGYSGEGRCDGAFPADDGNAVEPGDVVPRSIARRVL